MVPRGVVCAASGVFGVKRSEDLVLCRPGSDLLSRVLRRSTIGAEGLNGRVRNGIGYGPLARTTRPAKHKSKKRRSDVGLAVGHLRLR